MKKLKQIFAWLIVGQTLMNLLLGTFIVVGLVSHKDIVPNVINMYKDYEMDKMMDIAEKYYLPD